MASWFETRRKCGAPHHEGDATHLTQKYDVAILHRLSANFHFFVFVLAAVVRFQAFA